MKIDLTFIEFLSRFIQKERKDILYVSILESNSSQLKIINL